MGKISNAKRPSAYNSKRRFIRFAATPETIARIWNVASLDQLQVEDRKAVAVSGLVIDESYMGCSIVVHARESFKVGYLCVVKVGELSPAEAEVVWVRELEDGILRIGLRCRS